MIACVVFRDFYQIILNLLRSYLVEHIKVDSDSISW